MKLLPLLTSILSTTAAVQAQREANTSTSTSSIATALPLAIRYPPPSVRKAPHGYAGHNFASWTPPPPSYLSGTYHIAYTSRESWTEDGYTNLEIERVALESDDEGCRAVAGGWGCPGGSLWSVIRWGVCGGNGMGNETETGMEMGCKDASMKGYDIPIGA